MKYKHKEAISCVKIVRDLAVVGDFSSEMSVYEVVSSHQHLWKIRLQIGRIYSLLEYKHILFVGGNKSLTAVDLQQGNELNPWLKRLTLDGSKISGIVLNKSHFKTFLICGFYWDSLLLGLDLTDFATDLPQHFGRGIKNTSKIVLDLKEKLALLESHNLRLIQEKQSLSSQLQDHHTLTSKYNIQELNRKNLQLLELLKQLSVVNNFQKDF